MEKLATDFTPILSQANALLKEFSITEVGLTDAVQSPTTSAANLTDFPNQLDTMPEEEKKSAREY